MSLIRQLNDIKIKVKLLHIFKYYINDAHECELELMDDCFKALKVKYPSCCFNIQLISNHVRSSNYPNVKVERISECISQFYNRELYLEIIDILDF